MNPKEEPYNKVVINNYERAQILQEEKIGLVEKAAALVRRTHKDRMPWLTECRSSTDMSRNWTSNCETSRLMAQYQQIHKCPRC